MDLSTRTLRRNAVFKLLCLIFFILNIAFILHFSLENGVQSSSSSGNFIKMITELLNLEKGEFGTFNIEMFDTIINIPVRKMAHFFIYFCLGATSTLLFVSIGSSPLLAFFVCMICAYTDETIQLYTPGRSGQISDVILDITASIIAIIIVNSLIKFIKNKFKKNIIERNIKNEKN